MYDKCIDKLIIVGWKWEFDDDQFWYKCDKIMGVMVSPVQFLAQYLTPRGKCLKN